MQTATTTKKFIIWSPFACARIQNSFRCLRKYSTRQRVHFQFLIFFSLVPWMQATMETAVEHQKNAKHFVHSVWVLCTAFIQWISKHLAMHFRQCDDEQAKTNEKPIVSNFVCLIFYLARSRSSTFGKRFLPNATMDELKSRLSSRKI